jgi:hypothetical protein
MKLQATNSSTPTPRNLSKASPAADNSALTAAFQVDMAQIGESSSEMGIGKAIRQLFFGAVGAALGALAGGTMGAEHWGGLAGVLGGGVAGVVVGGSVGIGLATLTYSGMGDF